MSRGGLSGRGSVRRPRVRSWSITRSSSRSTSARHGSWRRTEARAAHRCPVTCREHRSSWLSFTVGKFTFEQRAQHVGDGLAALKGGDLDPAAHVGGDVNRSEEHTSELQSLMRISYAVFCLKQKNMIH